MARREWKTFLRRAIIWLPALLALWVPMTWVTRVFIQDMIVGNTTAFAAEIIHALAMAFRPDVLIAFILVQRSASRDTWHSSREEIAATFLTPSELIAGKAIVPVALLTLFHAVGIWFIYGPLLSNPDYTVVLMEGLPAIPMGMQIMTLAFVEDIFFAGVVVLIALRSYLLEADVLKATMGAAGRLLLFGLAVCLCSWMWPLLLNLLPINWMMWLLMDMGRFMVLSNMIWFALILPVELLLIFLLFRGLKRRLTRWLRAETVNHRLRHR